MDDVDDERAGYRKPPRSTRFKKGVSGNPSGRPKGRSTIPALLRKKLDKKVVVSRDGRKEKISMREVIVEGLIKDAATGTPATRLNAAKWLEGRDQETHQRDEFDYSVLTDEELDVLERILSKAAGQSS